MLSDRWTDTLTSTQNISKAQSRCHRFPAQQVQKYKTLSYQFAVCTGIFHRVCFGHYCLSGCCFWSSKMRCSTENIHLATWCHHGLQTASLLHGNKYRAQKPSLKKETSWRFVDRPCNFHWWIEQNIFKQSDYRSKVLCGLGGSATTTLT